MQTHQILAQLYELEEDPESAIRQYARLLNHDPRNVETYRSMKKLYLEIGRFDEAQKCAKPMFLASGER